MLERPIVELAPQTWLISEYQLVNMYLLEGADKALLIDCGIGLGDIPAEVRKLTDKPLIVVATHGHPDHDGAAAQFPEIYMHSQDIGMPELSYEQAPRFRTYYVCSRIPVRNPGADVEAMLKLIQSNGPVTRRPIEDGHVFELGNRPVEVIHTPGHTMGSVCLLDKKTRLLFNGDACNGESLLLNCTPYSSSVETFHKSMKKLWAREQEFDYTLWGHDNLDKCDKTLIQDYIEASEKLMEGPVQTEPTKDAMHSGYSFRYKRVLIWYDPNNIRNS